MTKRKWLGCAFALLLWVGVGSIFLDYATHDSWGSLLYLEKPRPSGAGSLVFFRESEWRYSTVYLFVRDPGALPKRTVRIGGPYDSDSDNRMEYAVWSRDGALIAVMGKGVRDSGTQETPNDKTEFVTAYDFRRHVLISPSGTKSRNIVQLIEEHGGAGTRVLEYPYMKGEDVSWMQQKILDFTGEFDFK